MSQAKEPELTKAELEILLKVVELWFSTNTGKPTHSLEVWKQLRSAQSKLDALRARLDARDMLYRVVSGRDRPPE